MNQPEAQLVSHSRFEKKSGNYYLPIVISKNASHSFVISPTYISTISESETESVAGTEFVGGMLGCAVTLVSVSLGVVVAGRDMGGGVHPPNTGFPSIEPPPIPSPR